MASIRKRTWKYQGRKRAAYEYSLVYDEDGQKKRVRRQFPTRAEAQEALDAFKEELKQPRPQRGPDADITLNDYADRWLEHVASGLAPRTVSSYRELLRLYIRPVLGTTKLRDIHRGPIKALLARLRERSLAKDTVRLTRATLSSLLGDAVEDGIIESNPALGIGRRGRKRPDSVTQAERQRRIKPLSCEQLAAFLKTLDEASGPRAQGQAEDEHVRCSRRDAVLFLTLPDPGLRPGEALALRWVDFDALDRTLRIERAVAKGQVKTTKTEETRYVDLTPPAARDSQPVAGPYGGRGSRGRAGRALAVHLPVSDWRPPRPHARRQALPPAPWPDQAPPLPALRSAPHPRHPPAGRGRPDHLRRRPARPRQADHDPGLLRSLAATGGQGVRRPPGGRAAGTGTSARGARVP